MARSTTPQQLELDLQAARTHGRWLSDEELSEIEQQERDRLQLIEKRQFRRNRLIVLTGVCLLIPPLWPLALVLTLYLLFPQTLARAGMIMGVLLVTLSLAAVGLFAAFITWLVMLLG